MLGAILEGGIGQYVAPDPSVPEKEDEVSIMEIIAPDPKYYASKKSKITTPKKSPLSTTPMKICTPSRTSILNNNGLLHTPNTNTLRSSPVSLKEAVLQAAEDTTKLLSSPTPIWTRSNDLFTICNSQKISEKVANKLRKALNNNPSLCHTRNCKTLIPDGYTLLHAAAASNNITAAIILLGMKKKDVDIDGNETELPLISVLTPDLQGRTALHVACEYGHTDMIKLLNEHLKEELGALPIGENAPVDLIGYTPLACALTSQSNKNKVSIRNDLFSPGDKSIFPKSSIKPRSSVKTDNIRYGYATCPGWRVYMEDSTCCATNLNDRVCKAFFGVFDGHADGCIVSDYLAQNVVTEFLKQRKEENGIESIKESLVDTCVELEHQLLNGTFMPTKACGSTAIMSIILNEHVIIGNVGDSRAIIVQEDDKVKVVEVSQDHKPNLLLERERIQNAGLEIVEETNEGTKIYKIQKNSNKLATSRSFGDFDFKSNKELPLNQQAVIAIPDVYIHERDAKDAFLVLASDGVWDVMTNEEVAEFVSTQFANFKEDDYDVVLAKIGDELIHECFQNRKSEDNISVVIVSLKKGYYDEDVEEIGEMVKRLDFTGNES